MHIQWAVRAQMEGMGVEIGMAYWGMGVVSFPRGWRLGVFRPRVRARCLAIKASYLTSE